MCKMEASVPRLRVEMLLSISMFLLLGQKFEYSIGQFCWERLSNNNDDLFLCVSK